MDIKSGERLAEIRDEEDQVLASYSSLRSVRGTGESYRSRFEALGARVMTEEAVVITEPVPGKGEGYTRKLYERTVPFSSSLMACLLAEMAVTHFGEKLTRVEAVLRRNDAPRDQADPVATETLGTADFEHPSFPIETWAKIRDLEDTFDTVDEYSLALAACEPIPDSSMPQPVLR